MIVKIAPLLAQYFYSTKHLDIPGVGTFHLEGEPVIYDEKNTEPIQGISFQNDRSVRESPELIAYISEHTGKIKALASADLDSYWQLAIQFLQIGKPFQIEGIGSLLKLQSGGYSFTPGLPSLERIGSERSRETSAEDDQDDYKSILYIKKISQGNWKKPVGIFLFIAGLGAAIWGGYRMSMGSTEKATEEKQTTLPEERSKPLPDSSGLANKKDSSGQYKPTNSSDSIAYKFVVETASKKRAITRYDYLSHNGIAVKMETSDSVVFDLYFLVKAASTDTLRIRDSLSRFYTPAGKNAYVKQ